MNRSMQIAVLVLNAFVLALEIALTRIFSVTMFYHFAFLAIGVALFGFGASGVLLYVWKRAFSGHGLGRYLGSISIWAGITAVASVWVALSINFNPHGQLGGIQSLKLIVIYLSTSVPFFFAGLAIALIFQRMSAFIARLYLLSLVGSAMGALLVVPILQVAGGPGAVIVIASLAFFASAGFYRASAHDEGKRVAPSGFASALIAALLLVVAGFVNPAFPMLKVTHAKGYTIDPKRIVYDRWNAFSRIIVIKGQNPDEYYLGGIHKWGISEAWNADEHPMLDQLWLEIDNTAGTPITKFSGDVRELEIAKYDVTAAAHYLLDRPSVLVVGPGGGKDLLAALAFGASKVDGAEINPLIGDVMRNRFVDFDGGLYDFDPIHVTVSEGRTFIARSLEKYDLIQISLIDTWAAATTGAYALSENNLYTIEAFEEYFDHLAPGGIFSMSRFADDPPRESLRVAALARAALEKRGIGNASDCVVIIKQGHIANVMVRPNGFREDALSDMYGVIDRLKFDILYMPHRQPASAGEAEYIYNDLLTTKAFDRFTTTYEFDIRPTTDDRPFFFYLLPPWEFLKALSFGKSQRAGYNSIAIFTLVMLLFISIAVTFIFIVLPLLLLRRADIRERAGPKLGLLGYFVCLGLAYILIEIALMQHFTLFLGYPIYSLVAVLTSLLFFSGLGAGFSGRVSERNLEVGIRNAVVGICAVAIVYIFALPPIFTSLIVLPDWSRIVITMALVLPLGWFMGQPFPLGLRIIERERLGVIPWAWGVNGAASVLGSTLALATAIAIGYRLTLFVGVAVYLVALLMAMLRLRR